MNISSKILSRLDELKKCTEKVKKENKRVVVCLGHFNVIHPGHLRFLEFAKKHGDYLIVVVLGEKKLDSAIKDKFYHVQERAHGVTSLEYVD